MSLSLNRSIITANTGLHSVACLEWESMEQICQIFGYPGGGPHGLTVCKSRQFLYCANSYSRTISVVDCLRGQALHSASVGTTPCHLAYCRGCGCLYVTNFDSDSVSVVREQDFQQIFSIPVGRMPHDILFSHQTGLLYVAVNGENAVAVLDPEINRVVDRIFLGSAPLHLKTGTGGRYLYAAGTIFEEKGFGRTRGEISIVDLERGTLAGAVSAGIYLTDVCVDEEEGILYAADGGEGCVHVVEGWGARLDAGKTKLVSSVAGAERNRSLEAQDKVILEQSSFPSCIEYVKDEGAILVGDHGSGKVMKYRRGDFQKLAESRGFKDLNHFLVL